jgi:sugar-specific transcriptional regulator TrmB
MADDSEFIIHFMRLGLSEKEAQIYLHLRRYGPEPLSVLVTLENHEEDIYRTLNGLIDKGLVTSSFESPTIYAAVELDVALDATVTEREMQLREKERRKRELQELSKQQRFRPSHEVSTYAIIHSLKELIGLAVSALTVTGKEWIIVCPAIFFAIDSLYAIEEAKKLIDRGGTIKVITDITYPYVESVQQHLDIGEAVRHFDKYRGVMFSVFDRKISLSAINADIQSISLDESLNMLWTDDPTYAEYLMSTFEMLWEHSVPAAQRIEELLKEEPPQA